MPGRYLIVDLQGEPPVLVQTDDVLSAALIERLDRIEANQEKIIMSMADQQAQLTTLTDGMNAVAAHVTAASTTLAQWIADHQSAPLDFTPALNALASIQAADSTLGAITPQVAPAPIDPVPAPPDPAPDPGTPVTDPTTPDPELPPPGDVTVATDPTTTPDVPPDVINPL